jgi:hypothetical protein
MESLLTWNGRGLKISPGASEKQKCDVGKWLSDLVPETMGTH